MPAPGRSFHYDSTPRRRNSLANEVIIGGLIKWVLYRLSEYRMSVGRWGLAHMGLRRRSGLSGCGGLAVEGVERTVHTPSTSDKDEVQISKMKLSTSLAALASLFVLSVVRADWLNNHCVSVMHTCNTAEQHDGYSACMCNLRWGKNNYPCRQGCYNSLYEPGLEPEKIRNNCDLLCDHGDVCVSLPSSCQPY